MDFFGGDFELGSLIFVFLTVTQLGGGRIALIF